MSLSELMIEIPAEYEANVFGQFDVYVKKLERTFHVTLISRDGATKIVGERAAAEKYNTARSSSSILMRTVMLILPSLSLKSLNETS